MSEKGWRLTIWVNCALKMKVCGVLGVVFRFMEIFMVVFYQKAMQKVELDI